jgi:hypothetical protein
MKTQKNRSKWPLMFCILTIIGTSSAKADSLNKLKDTLSKDFSNLGGFYIIGGLVFASLLIYFVYNHLIKEKEDPDAQKSAAKPGANYRRHRQHHVKHMVKK